MVVTRGFLLNLCGITKGEYRLSGYGHNIRYLRLVLHVFSQISSSVVLSILLISYLGIPARAFGAFGVTSVGGAFSVDTGAGLVFQVATNSGDITSIIYNGTQYQATDKNSQIASGLGIATVTATNLANNYIKITCATSPGDSVVSSLTHYLIVTNGLNTIFMTTFATAEPAVGELRWITRLQSSKLTFGPVPSDTRGNTGAIESTDILGMADGTTRSKYYGDTSTHGKDRAMDLTYCGATGTAVGAWMVFDNPRESDAGGPFFRDIENQDGGDQEVYNYMNSGHNQTESYRTGVLYGPYALVFNNGSPPSYPIDYSWVETSGLNLTGFVARASRGAVTGSVSGIPAGFQAVVGFANSIAQYWAVASNGTYVTPLMKTGTYTTTLYKGELGVAGSSVTVSAGATNTLNLTSGETNPSYIFRIGEWDGTPNGFLNATNIVAMIEPNFITMHPQDVRMSPWNGPTTYIVESNAPASFPSIQFRLTNSPTLIKFNLAPNQITNLTLRIGITCAYNNGRPEVIIKNYTNSPSGSSQPSSRSFTIGTYRGNNALFTYNIPSNNFVVGQNTLMITPISGSSDLGPWLSAGWVYDAVELDGPSAAISPPAAPTGLTAIASNTTVILNWNSSLGATGYNAKRSPISGGSYTTIASNVVATSYTDANVLPGTTSYYVVSALNAGGESTNSTEASAYVLSLFEQWQMNYFNCTNCAQAQPNADPYGKGMSNTNQFLAGFNPTNSAAYVHVISIANTNITDIDVIYLGANGDSTWSPGIASRTNVLEFTAGTADGSYVSNNFASTGQTNILSGGTGLGVVTNMIDAGGATNTSSRYYRVRVLVP